MNTDLTEEIGATFLERYYGKKTNKKALLVNLVVFTILLLAIFFFKHGNLQ